MDITPTEFRSTKFILSVDTEKLLGAAFSGLNTQSGSLISLKLKPLGDAQLTGNCKLHYVLHFDSVMSVSDAGISVLE